MKRRSRPGKGGSNHTAGRLIDDDPSASLNDPSTVDRWCELAEVALATNSLTITSIAGTRIVACPDTIEAEAYANGDEMPATKRLIRADGRTVAMFKLPAGW